MKKFTNVSLYDWSDAHTKQLDSIYSVRWNPEGQLLGTASHDGTAKLFDVRIEKVMFTGTTSDGTIYF